MKKLMRILLLIALLTAALCITAAATGETEATKPGMYNLTGSITPTGVTASSVLVNNVVENDYYADAVKFTVSATDYAAGEQCLVLVVAGAKGTAISDSSIYYINQTTVSSDNSVSFEAYPKDMAKDHYCVYLISASHPYNSTDPVPTAEFEYNIPYKLGDVNDDKAIDSDDALLVLKQSVHLVELDATQKLAANVNKDANIDSDDALLILKYSVHLIDQF